MHDRSTSLAVTTWRYASSFSAPSLRRRSQGEADDKSQKIRHLSRFDKAQTCPNRKMTYICITNERDSPPHSAKIKKHHSASVSRNSTWQKAQKYRPSYGWNVSAAKTCASFPLSFCPSARDNSLSCREAVHTICFSVPSLHTFSS